jgi:formate--tetrahydrofolate ligase
MTELKERIGNITIGFTYDGKPVLEKELGFEGSIAALLKDALKPNLVQTTENTPAIVHGGPFANIAQGANSIIATKTALHLADYVITEAGFGFDLGAEKFFDIVCPNGPMCTSAVVLVATVRALKHHGGAKLSDLTKPDVEALKKGLPNLGKHLENIKKFGMESVVAINRFSTDTDEELKIVEKYARKHGFDAAVVDFWAKGGEGGLELAEEVTKLVDDNICVMHSLYDWKDSVEDKIKTVAQEIYGAKAIDYTPAAKADLKKINRYGYNELPVCIAKTQKSLSDNPKLLGRPENFLVTVREILIASGAGFVIPITGEIMRMPGLPKNPAAKQINVNSDGEIVNLF